MWRETIGRATLKWRLIGRLMPRDLVWIRVVTVKMGNSAQNRETLRARTDRVS